MCVQVQSYVQMQLSTMSEVCDVTDKEFAKLCTLKFVLMDQVTNVEKWEGAIGYLT